MVPVDALSELDESLEQAWQSLCKAYDVTAPLPDMQTLFEGADLTAPSQAAGMVLVNMLSEILEDVSRFSPWYKMPASAFGLTRVCDQSTRRIRWVLSPEAARRWCGLLQSLRCTIQRNAGLIRAIVLVEGLMEELAQDDPCVTASCGCNPPRTILINQSVLLSTEIVCGSCQQPFHPAEGVART
ncbi:MAG TPA: hypothetical protein ENI95_06790 [Chloroflexi bacterium]|nr:hypothetical protein [Chloroflexota bacterium]